MTRRSWTGGGVGRLLEIMIDNPFVGQFIRVAVINGAVKSKMKGEVAQMKEKKPKKACGQGHNDGSEDRGIFEVIARYFILSLKSF